MESPPSSPKSRFSVQLAAGASSTPRSSQSTFPCPHDRWWASVSGMTVPSRHTGLGVLLLLVLSLLTTHASAALIPSFTNCLPEDVQQSPTHLQFHPLAVNATFDMSVSPYTLNITVYGNVTGKSSTNPSATKRWLSDLDVHGESWELVSGQYDDGARNDRRHDTGFMGSIAYPATKHEMFVEGMKREPDHRIHRRSDIQYETSGSIIRNDTTWNNKETTLQSSVYVLTIPLFDGIFAFCAHAKCPMQPVTNLRFVVM